MKNSELTGLIEVPISGEVVVQLLSHIPSDLVLVGGQALAFWVEHYRIDATPATGDDAAYVSRDADFLGKRDEGVAIRVVEKIAEAARSPASIYARKHGAEIYAAIAEDGC